MPIKACGHLKRLVFVVLNDYPLSVNFRRSSNVHQHSYNSSYSVLKHCAKTSSSLSNFPARSRFLRAPLLKPHVSPAVQNFLISLRCTCRTGGEEGRRRNKVPRNTESESLIKTRSLAGGCLSAPPDPQHGCQPSQPLLRLRESGKETSAPRPLGPVIYYSQLCLMESHYIGAIISGAKTLLSI